MKSIFIWSGVGLLIVGGLFLVFTFASPQGQTPYGEESGNSLSVPVSEADHVKGNRESDVALVEYGDFQCPACRSYFPIVARLEQDFGGRVAFVYRHFPLTIHANAEAAARAAEAAAMQGKFWEMHDILFEKQDDWAKKGNAEDIFVEYAVSLGLNPDQFRQDFKSNEAGDRVQGDSAGGFTSGVNSTPSFFLNGIKVRNPQSYEEFQQVIAAALADQGEGQPETQQPSGSIEGESEESTEAGS
jgi:protein-disulfide isomerase